MSGNTSNDWTETGLQNRYYADLNIRLFLKKTRRNQFSVSLFHFYIKVRFVVNRNIFRKPNY